MRSPGTFFSVGGSTQLFATAAQPQSLYGDVINTGKAMPGSLSALVAVTSSTATMTITAYWQVSQDGSTYYNVVPVNNAANTVMVTGTASATSVLPAGDVFGWKYARLKCVNGVANANGTTDSATITTRYSKV
jgi:hypothetical protein